MDMKKLSMEKVIFIMSVFALLLSVGAWMYTLKMREDVDRSSESMVQNIIELNNKHSLLQTCYEHNINPCMAETAKQFR
jgi:hypothetical protein